MLAFLFDFVSDLNLDLISIRIQIQDFFHGCLFVALCFNDNTNSNSSSNAVINISININIDMYVNISIDILLIGAIVHI